MLRDLSVALSKFGDAASAAGHGGLAHEALRETLALVRRLRAAWGDTPMVLRDLMIALSKLGAAERHAGRIAPALASYREA